MINKEQASNISYLYARFMESELKGWCEIDNYLELLEFLDDDQLYRETEILYSYHRNKNMGCPYVHTEDMRCFVPIILEAVEAITDLYKETNNLHPKNRYIISNYLALCQGGQICELPK
jgi:hypothetical protein